MDFKDLFQTFDEEGKLLLPDTATAFGAIAWSEHPVFEGVALKHIITAAQTGGQFSFHLVRIAPGQKIGFVFRTGFQPLFQVTNYTNCCISYYLTIFKYYYQLRLSVAHKYPI